MELASKYFEHFASGEIVASTTFPSFYDNFKEDEIVNEELKSNVLEKINLFQQALESVQA